MKRFRPSESTTAIPKVKETFPPKTTQKLAKPRIKDVITVEKEVTTSPTIESSFGFGNKIMKAHNVITKRVCEFLSIILSDPCESYRNISEATRHHSKPASKESRERYCDKLDAPNWTKKSPDWSGPGFYRFVGSAGNQMAARVQVLRHCVKDISG